MKPWREPAVRKSWLLGMAILSLCEKPCDPIDREIAINRHLTNEIAYIRFQSSGAEVHAEMWSYSRQQDAGVTHRSSSSS
jgi:hypothetical protein